LPTIIRTPQLLTADLGHKKIFSGFLSKLLGRITHRVIAGDVLAEPSIEPYGFYRSLYLLVPKSPSVQLAAFAPAIAFVADQIREHFPFNVQARIARAGQELGDDAIAVG
jgi:hypothetical protein